MNGIFFVLDTLTDEIASMNGKYLSHYNDTWVLSKEPERSASASGYGAVDEWEVLFNLQDESWLPVPEKQMTTHEADFSRTGARIVDVNVIGPFVDYVVKYQIVSIHGYQDLYFRDRNVDGVFSTADYSVFNVPDSHKSILGPYDADQTYIKQFNNSVMLYPNIRMVILGNAVVSYSYAVTSSRIGTILVPFGDLLEDYIPNIYSDDKVYIISKNATGYIRIIRLGTDIPNRIVRMAQYVHRINTVDIINILVERKIRITAEPGSLDWNNKFEIVNNVNTTSAKEITTYHINSGYNPFFEITGNRSSSMFVSNTIINLYGQLFNRTVDGDYSLNFINANLEGGSDSIDVFFEITSPPKYKYSIVSGVRRVNSRFDNLSFPEGVIVPFPLGTIWSMQNELIATGEMSQGLLAAGMVNANKTLDLYAYSNQIYFGRDSFDLFGVQYIFDGDYIYQDNERIAMAFGYIFIGRDNSAAYFYNPWDKSIYQFTGARNLNKFINLSNRTPVRTGRFDGFSGEMVILTEDEILKNRENIIMNYPYKPGNNIIATKHGPYIELEDGSRLLLSPLNGDVDPFELKTEFIGVDGSTICDYERIDTRLYSPDKTVLSFTVEMQTINQDTKQSEQKQITIKANDWSIDGYKTIKLIPQYKKGTGLSLRIYCEQTIYITGIEFTYNQVTRTANSQGSGY